MNSSLVKSLHEVVGLYVRHSWKTRSDEIHEDIKFCVSFTPQSGWEEDIDRFDSDRWKRDVESVLYGFHKLKEGRCYAYQGPSREYRKKALLQCIAILQLELSVSLNGYKPKEFDPYVIDLERLKLYASDIRAILSGMEDPPPERLHTLKPGLVLHQMARHSNVPLN